MTDLVPELAAIPAWSGIRLQHVLGMAAGLMSATWRRLWSTIGNQL